MGSSGPAPVTPESPGEGAAPLQGLAVAGQSAFDQLACLLGLGDPRVDLPELEFRQWAPPAPLRAAHEKPSHLLDGETSVAQQPDHGQATEDGGLVATTTAHASRGTQQASLFVEPKRGRAEPGTAGDLTDGEEFVGWHLTSSVLEVPAWPRR